MTKKTAPKETEVASYLREHPDFLSRHHDVLETLLPPTRQLGEGVSDFQRYLVNRLKGQLDQLRETQQALIAAGRDNEVTLSRIHGAALRLSDARSLEDLAQIIAGEIPPLCGVDAAVLAIESPDLSLPARAARLSSGTLESWLGPADTLLQSYATVDAVLFGPQSSEIRSLAMLRLDMPPQHPSCVLAFGSRDPEWFTPDQGTDLISFLAGITSRRLAPLLP